MRQSLIKQVLGSTLRRFCLWACCSLYCLLTTQSGLWGKPGCTTPGQQWPLQREKARLMWASAPWLSPVKLPFCAVCTPQRFPSMTCLLRLTSIFSVLCTSFLLLHLWETGEGSWQYSTSLLASKNSHLVHLSHKALMKVFKGNSSAVWPPCSVLKEQHCC